MRPSQCGSQMLVVLGATWIIARTVFAGFACLSNPCVYGVCIDDINSTYSCYCIDGYTGIQCQTNWDECWSSPCKNGGICHDGIAAFNCTCPDGFVGDVCELNYDECESNPCQNNGTCIDGENGYTCNCPPGYSGVHCELDIAVCNATNETRCNNGGLCIDGPGITFTCICTPGWTGSLCDIEINECESSPCKNGGICIDHLADYACACSYGFTGKNCEEEIIMCDENPCENDGLCLMEDTIPVCYCVPDFHGEQCQFQYDECQLGPRCKNGGTCIDGIDNFTCSCPPDLTGILCECLILNATEYDCTYVRPTPYYTTEISSSSREPREEETTTIILSTFESSTTPSTYFTSSTAKFPFSSTTESYVPNSTLSFETTSIKMTSSSENESSITTSTSTSTIPISSTLIDTTSSMLETTSKFPISEVPTDKSSITMTDLFFTTLETTLGFDISSSTELTTLTSNQIDIHTNVSTPTSTTFSEETSTVSVTTKSSLSTVDMQSTSDSGTSTMTIFSTKPPDISFPISSSTEQIPITLSSSTSELSTITTFLTEEPTSTIFTYTPSISTSVSPSTSFEFTSTEIDNVTMIPPLDCSKTFCLNGGTCLLTIEGHKCICPFDAEGILCEVKLGIKRAAFNGHSFLSHRLPKSTHLEIENVAKTLASNGILFYANMENTYMILFVQSGQLKFQFSCGFQTMLLSELKIPVNTGYQMSILAKLEFTKDLKYCNASLKVNNTLSMSGNQIAFVEHFTKSSSWLHLGGVPQEYVRDYTLTIPGFTGCMNNLKINGEKRNIFKDAQDGSNIKECSSLACLSDPCQNGATCVERNDTWSCHCRNGYIGDMCQQSICEDNPCQYGATCVPYTGSGYLCLCPYGKHGHFCENDLEIMTPSFSSSILGLSSYSAYPVPNAITHNMELSFKFVPHTMDQISLILFLGQYGEHDSSSDHLAVSFVRGYIMLTWNLGSGPRRIFTNKPIENYDTLPHTVRLGRYGRRAWLKVDHFANVTGRSPGNLIQLDVIPTLYLGGHNSLNFSSLPHDLPLHTGFAGCIFDTEMRAGDLVLPLQESRFATGRSLGQCSMIECHERSCQNGGVCIQHGPTFTCICQDGWFGPFCSMKGNPCDSTSHRCSQGSTCVPLVAGYECDCPIGKSGMYCEKDETLSDVSLSGKRSYILLSHIDFDSYKFIIEFELRPLNDRGLILYIGKLDTSSFLSVSMQGSGLEIRVSLGHHKATDGQMLVVRSNKLLAIGVWQPIRIGVSGRKVMLSVDGIVNSGLLQAGEVIPLGGSSIYIGGLPDLSQLPPGTVSTVPTSYNGCIRKFHINEEHIPLTVDRVSKARNIADCDGTPCGGDVCKNGGTCWLDPNLKARCSCPERYSGERCEIQMPCKDHGCENHGRCEGYLCSCTVGYGGAYCETEINVETPRFFGNSYLLVEKMKSADKKRNIKILKNEQFIHLNISTANSNGMILWSTKGEEYIGIGVERGYLKFVWTFPGGDTFVVEIPAIGHVSDGVWHEIEMLFSADNVTLWVDKILVHRQSSPNKSSHDDFLLNDRIFFIGGLPRNMTVVQETYGFFKKNFVGCIKPFTEEENTIDLLSSDGENIGDCEVF